MSVKSNHSDDEKLGRCVMKVTIMEGIFITGNHISG